MRGMGGLVLVAAMIGGGPVSAPAGAAGTSGVPVPRSVGNAAQVLAVRASGATARIQLWHRQGQRWVAQTGVISGYVGDQGVTGHPREGYDGTPAGVFTLTEAFGSQPDPGVHLPYRQFGPNDWWVSDVKSRYYNTWYTCTGSCPFDTSAGERLADNGALAYRYAMVIDYNRHPVRAGAGSAFFVHVSKGRPTAGCVAMPEADLLTVLRAIEPGRHPVIAISA